MTVRRDVRERLDTHAIPVFVERIEEDARLIEPMRYAREGVVPLEQAPSVSIVPLDEAQRRDLPPALRDIGERPDYGRVLL